jgi:predicted RNase H-related nuclease YkuK (DUF458 family)
MIEKTWKTMEGKKISSLLDTLKELTTDKNKIVHIGSDSQQSGKMTEFVTVVVVLEPGKGGRAFYAREKVSRVKSLRERLMREVMMSVTIGIELNEVIPDATDLTIHIDANPDVRFKSSNYVQELVGMVVSQGFKSLVKPDSWCASHTADHIVKHKVLGL